MNRILLISILFIAFITKPVISLSQDKLIKGSIYNSKGEALSSACVKLVNSNDQIVGFTYSDVRGVYTIKAERNKDLIIRVSSLGYKCNEKKIDNNSHYDFHLFEKTIHLDEVSIISQSPVIVHNDTTKYKLKAFRDSSEMVIEDVLKKVPHIQVANNGDIYYKGSKIDKILFEDDDLLGDNFKLATRNIDSRAISEVHIIQNYSENPIQKEFEESSKVALNLKFDDEFKNVILAKIALAYSGTHQHELSGHLSRISKKNKLFVYGSNNNINGYSEEPFNNDILNDHDGKISNEIVTFNNYVPDIDIKRFKFDKNQFYSLNYIKRIGKNTKIKTDLSKSTSNSFFKRNHNTVYNINDESFSLEKNEEVKINPDNYAFLCELNNNRENNSFKIQTLANYETNDCSKTSQNKNKTEDISRHGLSLHNKLSYIYKMDKLLTMISLNTDNNFFDQNYDINIVKAHQKNHFNLSRYELKFNIASYSRRGKYSLELGVYSNMDKFKTGLQLDKQATVNDVSLSTNSLYLIPRYSFRYGGFKFNSSVDIKCDKLKLSSENNILPAQVLINILPKFTIGFNKGQHSLFLDMSTELDDLSSSTVYPNYLLIGDRYLYRYDLSYDNSVKTKYTINYHLYSLSSYIELNCMSSIIRNSKSWYDNILISNTYNYTERTRISKPQTTYLSNLKVRKYIPILYSNIAVNFTYLKYSIFNSINSDIPVENKFDTYIYKLVYSTVSLPFVNLSLGSEYTYSKYKYTQTNVRNMNSKLDCYLNLTSELNKKMSFKCFVNRSTLGLSESRSSSVLFLDANIGYRFNNHFYIKLSGYNLSNVKSYDYFTSNDYAQYSEENSVVPRTFILKLSYSL